MRYGAFPRGTDLEETERTGVRVRLGGSEI